MDETITEKVKTFKDIPGETADKNVLRGELIQGKENISRLSSDWDKLFARAKNASVYLSHAWIQTFIDEEHCKGELCFIAVWNGKELAALLPICIQNIFGIRIGKLISTEVPSYLGLLVDPDYPSAISIVAETWIKEKVAHVFHDKHVSSLDEATHNFVTELKHRGFNYKYGYQRISYGIELGCSFDEYMQKNKSGKRRRKLGYAERQLFNSGNVEVKNYKGKEITSEILKRIAQVQEESWLKQRGASVLKEPFYQKLLTSMSQAGFGSVWLMTIDGDDAAFAFTSIAHETLYYQYVAFKLKYESSLSIGQMLLMQIIRDACDKNVRYFEFGHGEGGYKRFWSNQSSNVLWVIAGRGLIGNIMILCYKLAWFLAGQKRILSLYQRIRDKKNRLNKLY
jgi:CelD/BcsL family acetyltransferase involved in cellulose biosynthesis